MQSPKMKLLNGNLKSLAGSNLLVQITFAYGTRDVLPIIPILSRDVIIFWSNLYIYAILTANG